MVSLVVLYPSPYLTAMQAGLNHNPKTEMSVDVDFSVHSTVDMFYQLHENLLKIISVVLSFLASRKIDSLATFPH